MYGMIHRGIRQMIIDSMGASEWSAIEASCGVGPAEQISLETYDDSVTVGLLAAAADRMGVSTAECLRTFGRYWIRFAEQGSFGAIMDFTGRDLASFISNLDRMHRAVQTAMPKARVPSFSLVAQAPGELRVAYRSEREGLEPFVGGLLEGVLERFGMEGTVRLENGRSNAAEFVVSHA